MQQMKMQMQKIVAGGVQIQKQRLSQQAQLARNRRCRLAASGRGNPRRSTHPHSTPFPKFFLALSTDTFPEAHSILRQDLKAWSSGIGLPVQWDIPGRARSCVFNRFVRRAQF